MLGLRREGDADVTNEPPVKTIGEAINVIEQFASMNPDDLEPDSFAHLLEAAQVLQAAIEIIQVGAAPEFEPFDDIEVPRG